MLNKICSFCIMIYHKDFIPLESSSIINFFLHQCIKALLLLRLFNFCCGFRLPSELCTEQCVKNVCTFGE